MKKNAWLIALVFLIITFISVECANNKHASLKTFNTPEKGDLKDFFSYSSDRIPLVCAHRGGDRDFFPENCIATFENTLSQVHSMIETDPRYTKDSIIVLMHDATLNRTTNGTGKVSDYTLEELKKLRLKDAKGNVTDYQIPTLAEALEWARSKTILVLDRKDVPVEARIKMIEEHNAETYAILIAYSVDEIRRCHELNPDIIMEIMLADTAQVNNFDRTGVPWENVVGFVSHNLVKDPGIFEIIHSKGAMCIVGSSRNHDLGYKNGEIKTSEDLYARYVDMVTNGADVIEADLAIEAGLAIINLVPPDKSKSKGKYFTPVKTKL
jgi:glycerophosphoryl diester phosphodiesterase